MAIFNIDKKIEQLPATITGAIKSELQIKAGPFPEEKTRMIFRSLKTVEGRSLPEVELLIDPQSIQVAKNVIQNKTLTKGGWVVQFWGHDITQINVSAITGNFQPLYGAEATIPSSLSKRDLSDWGSSLIDRWSKGGGPLKVFEKIKEYVYMQRYSYDEPWKGNPIIDLVWENYVYSGYFTNFNYNLASNQPFNINYSFTFMALKRKDMSLSDAFGTTDIKKFVSDPLGTVRNKTKQLTSVGLSWAKKETTKLINSNQITSKINSTLDLIDDLPNKITLW